MNRIINVINHDEIKINVDAVRVTGTSLLLTFCREELVIVILQYFNVNLPFPVISLDRLILQE